MDFEKTEQLYEKYGQKKMWDQLPIISLYNKEKSFFEKTKSKRTGEFYQADDLIKRELVPADWQPPHIDTKTGKPLKYPIRHVNEIIMKRLVDGSEWLLSREMWTGLDEAGNPVSVSFNDKQYFDNILVHYKLKPDPKSRTLSRHAPMMIISKVGQLTLYHSMKQTCRNSMI